MFYSLLERPVIKAKFLPKYMILIKMIENELDTTKRVLKLTMAA